MTQHLLVAAGWTGAVVLLLGYAQTSRGRWAGDDPVFQACSVFGSASLALAAAAGGVWSSAALNVAWMAIGVSVMAQHVRRRRLPAARRGEPNAAC